MSRTCTWPGCTRPLYAKGLCNPHRLRRMQGRPMDAPVQVREPPRDDEGPDAPPHDARAEAARYRRLLDALRDGVSVAEVAGRFDMSELAVRQVAEREGISTEKKRRGAG